MNSRKLSGGWAGIVSLVIVAAVVIGAWRLPSGWNWIAVAVLMAAFMIVLGLHISGRASGILISERNLISLARFQMTMWTVIILSAYFVMAILRIKAGAENPLGINIDWHLWALMGISTTSLVTVPLIQTSKKQKEPDQTEVEKTAKIFNEKQDDVEANRQGVLYANSNPSDACFADMFQGDEIKNTCHVDLAKVQMFFFTIIAAFSYCVILYHTIAAAGDDVSSLDSFPALSEGMIALLGISHAGYLASKTADHTKEAEPEKEGPAGPPPGGPGRGAQPQAAAPVVAA